MRNPTFICHQKDNKNLIKDDMYSRSHLVSNTNYWWVSSHTWTHTHTVIVENLNHTGEWMPYICKMPTFQKWKTAEILVRNSTVHFGNKAHGLWKDFINPQARSFSQPTEDYAAPSSPLQKIVNGLSADNMITLKSHPQCKHANFLSCQPHINVTPKLKATLLPLYLSLSHHMPVCQLIPK